MEFRVPFVTFVGEYAGASLTITSYKSVSLVSLSAERHVPEGWAKWKSYSSQGVFFQVLDTPVSDDEDGL